jgi:NAD(P)H-nitrite reductase large subunit
VALGRLFEAPHLVDQLASPETLVCRCEEVTLRTVNASFDEGTAALGAVKRVTRAGMGRCQGRYCAPVLADLLARRSGSSLDEAEWFAPAPPFKPMPVATVVDAIAALGLRGDGEARTG